MLKVPRLTVLMTVYNGGNYLKRSILSVLNQTFQDFEFLIINDCSTDNSLEMIRSFNDPRIVIHTNQQNMGQTKSLNVGFKLAKGEYIARIDADDVAFPDWLKQQVSAAETYPEYTVISAYAVVVDENDKCLKVSNTPQKRGEIIMRSLIRSPINHVGSLMKKERILELGGYDEKYRLAADYDLWVKLLKNHCLLTTTPQTLMSIRSHSQSATKLGRGNQDVPEIEDIMKKAIGHFTNVGFQEHDLHLLCKAIYDEGSLDDDEFDTAIEVLKRVYENLTSAVPIEEKHVLNWTRHQCRVIYLKRIHHFILIDSYKDVRRISRKGVEELSIFSIFPLLFLASYLGRLIIKMVPGVYFQFHKGRARLGLLNKCW